MRIAKVQSIGDRLLQRIERITGTNVASPTFSWNADNDIAGTAGSSIGLNKAALAGASRREVKGILAHELGHVLQGADSSLTGVQQEAYGDALRDRLGLGKGAGISSKQETQMQKLSNTEFQQLSAMAQSGGISRSWLKEASMAGTDGNGPKVGEGGRMRNTAANALSKSTIDYQNPGGAAALPPLDPASTANYYSQLAGLYAGYQSQLVALKQQRIGARADFSAQAAQVRGEKVSNLAGVENQAIESGMLGSSADLQQRGAVRGAAAAGIQAAQRQKMQTVAQTRLDAQAAGIDYFMGAQGLEAQKLAQQQTMLADQLERNLIISGQETQMDYLKQMFENWTQQGVKNPTKTNRYGGSAGIPDEAGTVQFWLKLGMDQRAASQNAKQVREGLGLGTI